MEKQSKQAGSLKLILVEKLTNRSHMSIPIQDLTPAIPLHKETKKTLSARPAFRNEAGKKQESEFCI
jgi:hypothetical protein